MKKKLFAILLGVTMSMSIFTGCGNSNSSSAGDSNAEVTEKKDELVFANFRDIRDPNPHLYQGEMWFQEMVYETLVSVEPSGIEPCLAESWTISEDGLTYTFKIREGVMFTDGEICDANAIKANFDAIWDNIDRHVWMESARIISSYEVLDNYTFEIKLSEPYYPLLTELGVTRPYGIGSPKTFKDGTTKNGVTEYIGTGTYKMGAYKENEYVTMDVNESYWGDIPQIPKITMKVIPENQTRILALEKGEVDLIYGGNLLEASTLEKYQDSDKFTPAVSEPTLTKHLILNTHKETLADENVRIALNHAINKQEIADSIFHGIEPVADYLFAKNVPYCNIDLKPYDYDLEKAEKILEDAGWKKGTDGIREKDGVRLHLSFVYDNNAVIDKTICEYLQAKMLDIGIGMELKGYERQTYFDMLKQGDFDITINIPWGNPYDPHAALSAMRGQVYGDYEAQLGLENKAEIDEAITKVLVSVDENERQELYNFILTELHEAALYIPLVYETNKALFTNKLDNVGFMTSSYVTPFWNMFFK